MNEKIEYIPIEKILEPREEIRSYITREALDELKTSIEKYGILSPLKVRPIGDKFEIVYGHRRFIAAKELGFTHLPCIVEELDDKATLIQRIHENVMREEMNIIDQVNLVHRLYDREGMSYKEIGEVFGKSESWARDMDRLWYCDEEIKAALMAGHIKKSHAIVLMRHPDRERRIYFLKLCIENGASPKTLDLWIRDDLGVIETIREATPIQKISDLKKGAGTVKFRCATCDEMVPGDAMYVIHLCERCYRTLMETKRGLEWQDTTRGEDTSTRQSES